MANRKRKETKHVVWPSCAWVLLSFFPYPVAHPEHEHCTGLGERAGPRLRKLAPRDQRESGGGIHAT